MRIHLTFLPLTIINENIEQNYCWVKSLFDNHFCPLSQLNASIRYNLIGSQIISRCYAEWQISCPEDFWPRELCSHFQVRGMKTKLKRKLESLFRGIHCRDCYINKKCKSTNSKKNKETNRKKIKAVKMSHKRKIVRTLKKTAWNQNLIRILPAK